MKSMDELEFLKQQWSQLSKRTQGLEEANRELANRLATSRTTSIQDKLARRILVMAWVGLTLPILAPVIYYVVHMSWWVAVIYGLFGVVMSILSFTLGDYIRAVRLTDLPVKDAIERAAKIKIRQQQFRMVGIAGLVIILGLMIYQLPEGPDREPIIVGGSVGLAVGLVIGIYRYIVNARLARQLVESEELRAKNSDE